MKLKRELKKSITFTYYVLTASSCSSVYFAESRCSCSQAEAVSLLFVRFLAEPSVPWAPGDVVSDIPDDVFSETVQDIHQSINQSVTMTKSTDQSNLWVAQVTGYYNVDHKQLKVTIQQNKCNIMLSSFKSLVADTNVYIIVYFATLLYFEFE